MTLPTLWLYGTSGVGKTTTAWELFRELPGPVGFVDIDQIGMFYGPPTAENWAPEPACDLGRHRMKARNLNAVAANFRAFGAACLIVPGIADETLGPAIAVLPNVALTAVRLRADRADLAKRIAARGRPNDELEPIAEYADALDRLPGPCVDTTGLDVPSVVSRVRAAIGSWPGPAVPGPAVPGPAVPGRVPATCDQPGDVLWLCGPTAIGKSSVAWQAYQQLMRAGTRTAYIDLDQVGFRRPATAGNHRLKAANLASLWQTYAGEGARRLVMAGPATAEAVDIYRSALPSARLSICRLRATPATLSSRVHARGRGDSPAAGLAGDLLAGASVATLNRIAAEAISDAAELERAGVGDFALDTDDRTPADLATEILDRVSASAPD